MYKNQNIIKRQIILATHYVHLPQEQGSLKKNKINETQSSLAEM